MRLRTLMSHLGAVVLVSGLVGGVLFAEGGSLPAAAAGMPDRASAPPASDAPVFTAYPGMNPVQVTRGMHINGQHMDLDVGVVDAQLDDVVAFYQNELDRPGAPVRTKNLPDGSVYLVAPTPGGRLEGVLVRPIESSPGHPEVLVMPTLSSGPIVPGREAAGLTVPLPRKHSALTSYRTRDGSRIGTSVAFLTDTGMKALSAWYRDRLQSAGWTAMSIGGDEKAPGSTRLLRYQRGARRVTIALKGMKGDGTTVDIVEQQEVHR